MLNTRNNRSIFVKNSQKLYLAYEKDTLGVILVDFSESMVQYRINRGGRE